jgi:hypothetical protein
MVKMDDVIKSIKAHLYDRVVSPLFGAFVISWCVWNYRVIFVLLSSEIIPYKFNYIDEYYSSALYFFEFSFSKLWVVGILAPLISAFFYIYAYPFFALPVYRYSLYRQKRLNDVKNEIEGNTLLTLDKSRKIIQDAKKMQIEHSQQMSNAEEEIESLKRIITEQDAEIKKFRDAERGKNNIVDEESASENHIDMPDSEIDSLIVKGIEQLVDGSRFQLSELFDEDAWASIAVKKRQSIGKNFKDKVERGDYLGISLAEKGSGNQQFYYFQKSPSQSLVDDDKNLDLKNINKVLSCYAKLDGLQRLTPHKVSELIGLHHMEAQVVFDSLERSGFVKAIPLGRGDFAYELLAEARKYIVNNNLHI